MKGFQTKEKNSSAFHYRRCKRENTRMILTVLFSNVYEEHLPFHLLNNFMPTFDGYKRIR